MPSLGARFALESQRDRRRVEPQLFGDRLRVLEPRKETKVTAIVYALSRAVQSADEFDALKLIAIFCGIGLLASLAALTYGLDLSPGFF
jgi:hypothetical protein